nr:hypothetical protein [Tanacetum cinerariifolium]
MPFGLKNVEATYQRLVDTIFEGQIGRNLEAYVDDMVIKSKTEPEMIKDVEETLLTLKKQKSPTLPRNPQKVFKQKGLSLDNRGRRSILGNEETDNGATNFNGLEEGRRTHGLPISSQRSSQHRPISGKTWETSPNPLHHTIKVITNKPLSQILNNQEATGRLAKWGIELEAYGIKYGPRSAKKGQVLIDFLADTLAEDNYMQVKVSGPNDTLTEGKSKEEQETLESKTPKNLGTKTDIWKLYNDGASNKHGSEAGLILIDPNGVEYSYALRLNFANSNNDANMKRS